MKLSINHYTSSLYLKLKYVLLLLLFSSLNVSIMAQTNTFTGAFDNDWDDTANWSAGVVPTAIYDVVIPAGTTPTVNVAANVNSLTIESNATLNLESNVTSATTVIIQADAFVNWISGSFSAAAGITNNGWLDLNSVSAKSLNSTTLMNNGMIMVQTNSAYLNVASSTIINQITGILDVNTTNIYGIYNAGGSITNYGTIQKSQVGTSLIGVPINNVSGTFDVQQGILNINGGLHVFENGVYNTSAGAELVLNSGVTGSGTWTGNNDGAFKLVNTLTIPESCIFNFNNQGFQWVNGTINGDGTLTNDGIFNMMSTSTKTLNTITFENNNLVYLEDETFYINMAAESEFINQSGATLEIAANSVYGFYNAGVGTVLKNYGTIEKTTPGANVIGVVFENYGTIHVIEGTLNLNGGNSILSGGVYNVDALGVLELNSNHTLEGTLTGNIDGVFQFDNVVEVPTSVTNEILGNGILWNTGTIQGGGTFINNSLFRLSSAGYKTLTGATTFLNNQDFIIESTSSYLTFTNDAVLHNSSLGTIDIQSTNFYGFYPTGPGGTVVNDGVMLKSVGGDWGITASFINNNIIDVQVGQINFSGGNTHYMNGGIYNVSPDATLDFNGNVELSGTLSGANLGNFYFRNNIFIPVEAINEVSNKGVSWISGTITGGGTIINNSLFVSSTSTNKTLNGATTFLNNMDFLIESTSGYLTFTNDAVVHNSISGTIDIKCTNFYGFYSVGVGGSVMNDGVILKSEGDNWGSTIPVTNNGRLIINSGTLSFNSCPSFINSLTGSIEGPGTIVLPIPANYINQGIFAPGSPVESLQVNGDFESEATSKLEIEINGITPETEYDVINVSGAADILGDLEVKLGFAPAVGNQFVIFTSVVGINTCLLPTSITAWYNNSFYTFDVICTANEIILERSCISPVGCTNDWACNYNPLAMCEDASCILLDGDADHSGSVDILDLIAVSSNFGCSSNCPVGDANYDYEVNILDLVTVSSNFGNTCPG